MAWLKPKVLTLVAMLAPIFAHAEGATTPENITDIAIEAEIPRGGDFMGFGFDSLWIMSGMRLARINPALVATVAREPPFATPTMSWVDRRNIIHHCAFNCF